MKFVALLLGADLIFTSYAIADEGRFAGPAQLCEWNAGGNGDPMLCESMHPSQFVARPGDVLVAGTGTGTATSTSTSASAGSGRDDKAGHVCYGPVSGGVPICVPDVSLAFALNGSMVLRASTIGDGLGKLILEGGGDENSWSDARNRSVLLCRPGYTDDYCNSIETSTGSSAAEYLHWTRFGVANADGKRRWPLWLTPHYAVFNGGLDNFQAVFSSENGVHNGFIATGVLGPNHNTYPGQGDSKSWGIVGGPNNAMTGGPDKVAVYLSSGVPSFCVRTGAADTNSSGATDKFCVNQNGSLSGTALTSTPSTSGQLCVTDASGKLPVGCVPSNNAFGMARNLASAKPYTVSPAPTSYLDAGGELTDGYLGTQQFQGHEASVGWFYTTTVTVRVDLGSSQACSSAAAYVGGGLPSSNIQVPTSVAFATSDDDSSYTTQVTVSPAADSDRLVFGRFPSANTTARYVRFTFTVPSGRWLMLGEVAVFGGDWGSLATKGSGTANKLTAWVDGQTLGDGPSYGTTGTSVLAQTTTSGTLSTAIIPALPYIPTADKGSANGVAPLGADSKVPAANLPSFTPDDNSVTAHTGTDWRIVTYDERGRVKSSVPADYSTVGADPAGAAATVQNNLNVTAGDLATHVAKTTDAHGGLVPPTRTVCGSGLGSNVATLNCSSTITGDLVYGTNGVTSNYGPIVGTNIDADGNTQGHAGADVKTADLVPGTTTGPLADLSSGTSQEITSMISRTINVPSGAHKFVVFGVMSIAGKTNAPCRTTLYLDSIASENQVGASTEGGLQGGVEQSDETYVNAVTGTASVSGGGYHTIYFTLQSSAASLNCTAKANRSSLTILMTPG